MRRLCVLGPEAGALLDSETVLFVDDDQPQVGEAHAVLDQGVRADEDRHLARGDTLERGAALGRLRGAGQYGHAHRHPVKHPRDRGEVLAGEDLRGGHHAGLEAVVHGQQHRQQRHEGLAAAHVALQQAVHLETRHGVLPDLADDALLGTRQREGELAVVEGVEHFADLREEESVALRETGRAARLHVELYPQQLVELEPVLGLPEQFLRLREMDVVEGLAQGNQPVLRAQRFGKRVADAVADQPPEVADDLVHALRAELVREFLGRGVDALHAALGLA